MNLPDIPTDNLYKFMALSGLAILAFSIVYPISLKQQFSEADFEIKTELKKRDIEHQKLGEETKSLSQEMEALKERYIITDVEADPVDEERIKELKEKAKDQDFRDYIIFMREYYDYLVPGFERVLEIGELNEKLIEKIHQQMIKSVEIEMGNERLSSLSGKILIANICSVLGIFAGLLLSISGFYFWYNRVQKYHDMRILSDIPEQK